MMDVLQKAYEAGELCNRIEMAYYIAPQEPTEFTHNQKIFAAQYSRRTDAVLSANKIPNKLSGGSSFGQIPGISEFREMPGIDSGKWGLKGGYGGHLVSTFRDIFNIAQGAIGHVRRFALPVTF